MKILVDKKKILRSCVKREDTYRVSNFQGMNSHADQRISGLEFGRVRVAIFQLAHTSTQFRVFQVSFSHVDHLTEIVGGGPDDQKETRDNKKRKSMIFFNCLVDFMD